MKILFAIHHFPPSFTGGAEWEAYNTAAALQARGHTVRVVCVEKIHRGCVPPGTLHWQDDEYQGLPVRRLMFDLSSAPDPFVWGYDNAWIGEHFRTLITEFQPDVVHLMGGYLLTAQPILAAQSLSVPTVVSLMDFWFLCPRISMLRSDGQLSTLPINPTQCARCVGEERRSFKWLGQNLPAVAEMFWRGQTAQAEKYNTRLNVLRSALNSASALINRSDFVRQLFVQAGFVPERFTFIRQGRDFPAFTPAELAKTPTQKLRVGYLGQIAEHKGVHVLLEAARHLPQAAFTVKVYGNTCAFPAYTQKLENIIGADSRLQLAGTYSGQAELLNILREVDVLVVPSVWYENSPNVILEAFAHQTPVIVSNLGGMAELVTDGVDGLHFAPGDAADLARRFQRLMGEPDLLPRLRAGIRSVKTLAQEMDELEAVYQQIHKVAARAGAA
jgi:glycosyltransferase involved in cell wall biosynthesis